MGNSNTKESRSGDNPDAGLDGRREPGRSRNRISRGDLGGFLNLQQNSRDRDRDRQNVPFERRETRQEREARRLERDRVARARERERSMREEHIDGGFLVTLGVYTGIEDFSKAVVRQLQIERKLAPFWRGLNDWSASWAEHQLVAAARGLPIPAADAPPDPALVPQPSRLPEPASNQNLGSLTVPMGSRTLSAASDRSESGIGSDLPSPAAAGPSRSSTFKPRAKAIAAALSVSSRNASTTDLTPKEIVMPHEPFVNGQPIEVFLYKEAAECPICFLSYPPYLNRTRCCDQLICSECFVQIKRADPHLPEHHPDGQARDPNQGLTAEDPPEMLISEPSTCPYCQQTEFGVTYEPPPFRRGLVYSTSSTFASSTAMSSQSSLNSSPPPMSPQQAGRRRTHSLSATAPNVITTDRVRPDWATKLAAARAHQARRAAAATALHTAAFLMGGNEQRSILRPVRFGRRSTGGNGTGTPGLERSGSIAPEGAEPAEGGPSARSAGGRRRSRMEDLEEMMFMEAVRLSLATEEERKRKEEKALRKETKKRQQAERKAQKKQGKDPYGEGASGASASSLSLGLGRKRGSSAASNLRMEATLQGASQASRSEEAPPPEPDEQDDHAAGKGKGVDRGTVDAMGSASSSTGSLRIPPGNARSATAVKPPPDRTGAAALHTHLASTTRIATPAVKEEEKEEEETARQGEKRPGRRDGEGDKPQTAAEAARHGDDEKARASPEVTITPETPTVASRPGGAGLASSRPSSQVVIAPDTPNSGEDASAERKSVGRSSITERPSPTAH
ncbi:hypothetical protein CDD83_3938 [Cordyceps sp. RAO-2017]|nr:hypothetical protein CDD83_3938 [Cordyceps sp. RAO-2017]